MTAESPSAESLADGRRHRVQVERLGYEWGAGDMGQTILILHMRLPDGTDVRYRGRSKQMIRAIGEEYLPQFALTAAFETGEPGRSTWLELRNPTKLQLKLREDGLVPPPENLKGAWHLYAHDHNEDEDGHIWIFSEDTLVRLWLRVRESPVAFRLEGSVLYVAKQDYQIRFLDPQKLIMEYADKYLVFNRYRKPIDMDHFRFTA